MKSYFGYTGLLTVLLRYRVVDVSHLPPVTDLVILTIVIDLFKLDTLFCRAEQSS
jgi:hypothetical protein